MIAKMVALMRKEVVFHLGEFRQNCHHVFRYNTITFFMMDRLKENGRAKISEGFNGEPS